MPGCERKHSFVRNVSSESIRKGFPVSLRRRPGVTRWGEAWLLTVLLAVGSLSIGR